MAKSADAFRTISEVAEWLGIPAHVLRFWESKFTQVKPVKRAGGRRYYRPADMLLLGGIRKLLHEDGMTIKGVQKILREQGVKDVAALSPPLDVDAEDHAPISGIALDVTGQPDEPRGQVLNFGRDKTETSPATAEDAPDEADDTPSEAQPPAPPEETREPRTAATEESSGALETDPLAEPDSIAGGPDESEPQQVAPVTEKADEAPKVKPKILRPTGTAAMPGFLQKSLDERSEKPETEEPAEPDAALSDQKPDVSGATADSDSPPSPVDAQQDQRPTPTTAAEHGSESETDPAPEKAAAPAPPRAKPITTPPDPADDEITGKPSALSALAALRTPDPDQAALLAELAARLRAAQDTARPSRGA